MRSLNAHGDLYGASTKFLSLSILILQLITLQETYNEITTRVQRRSTEKM